MVPSVQEGPWLANAAMHHSRLPHVISLLGNQEVFTQKPSWKLSWWRAKLELCFSDSYQENSMGSIVDQQLVPAPISFCCRASAKRRLTAIKRVGVPDRTSSYLMQYSFTGLSLLKDSLYVWLRFSYNYLLLEAFSTNSFSFWLFTGVMSVSLPESFP